jgi:hypothetical protein
MAFIYFLAFSLGVAIWASLNTISAAIAMVVMTIAVIAIYFRAALVIEVDENELRVGKAHIDRKYCGGVTILTPKEMSRTRTRDADPAAFLAIRFWTAQGVKIEIRDSRDATPYWLCTTKRGADLVRALGEI